MPELKFVRDHVECWPNVLGSRLTEITSGVRLLAVVC